MGASHFGRMTIAALARKGIRILGLRAIPGAGDMPFANATTGYAVDDNGCGRIWSFAEVMEAAR